MRKGSFQIKHAQEMVTERNKIDPTETSFAVHLLIALCWRKECTFRILPGASGICLVLFHFKCSFCSVCLCMILSYCTLYALDILIVPLSLARPSELSKRMLFKQERTIVPKMTQIPYIDDSIVNAVGS